jgi:predicted Co/Zn/Cd cation transporter (cation efflux family)
MTKTGLEFGILVIVICLIFDICDLEFISHFSRLLQGGKSMEAPFVAVRSRVLCASFTNLPPLYKQLEQRQGEFLFWIVV